MIMETINNILIELYATMAQAEIEKKEKRQREGIQAKKDRGDWDDYGRPRVMTIDEFSKHYGKVIQGKIKPFELMHELVMSKPTFYRYKREYEKNMGC
jgi:DNA invertase Pin-like site-specific DNA recombinase